MTLVLLNGTLNRVVIIELRRGVINRGGDDFDSNPACTDTVIARLPIRQSPLVPRLASSALHLDGHTTAVRRPYDHAVRPDRAVGGDTDGPAFLGPVAASISFLMVGLGLPHPNSWACVSQRLSRSQNRSAHRVVALLYVMLLLGGVIASVAFAWLRQASYRQN